MKIEHAQYRVEICIKPRDYTRLTQKSRGNLCNLVVKILKPTAY